MVIEETNIGHAESKSAPSNTIISKLMASRPNRPPPVRPKPRDSDLLPPGSAADPRLFAKTNAITSTRAKSPAAKSAVDSKAQSLLTEVLDLLNEVYPEEDAEVSKDRETMLDKLKPYQNRQACLTSADRIGLLTLQLALTEAQESTRVCQFE